jgi:lipid II:glycine glycyltransferase (peptidoglycan interpeptide bridge formation enzyme)
MDELQRRFPEAIHVRAAVARDRVVASLVLYHVRRTVHAQYIATRFGAERGALDLLIESAIDEATQWGARYFDFGISNEEEGRVLNEGLFQFKSEFGAGTTPYEHYELALDALEA